MLYDARQFDVMKKAATIEDRERAARARTPPARACAICQFAGPRHPIRVEGVDALLGELGTVLPDWPRSLSPGGDDEASTDIRVERRDGIFRIVEGNPVRAETDYADAEDAAFGLAGALLGAFVTQDESFIALHAASVCLAGRLAMLLGDTKAGKSTLAAHLVQLGHRSFGDDRIIVELGADGHDAGVAVPIPHRLRLPLPVDVADGFDAFVEAHIECRWEDAVQLRLTPGEAACFGECAPLGAFVLLERGTGEAMKLERVSQARIVRELVRQSFAPGLRGDVLLKSLVGLAARVPAYRLAYGRAAAAANLVAEHFGAARGAGVR